MSAITEKSLSNGIAVMEAGEGSPVILLHGIGGAARLWRFQLTGLSHHHRVVAWDMPGHGRSAPAHEMTFAGLTRALHETLSELGLHRPVLLGHSMGAMVALDYVNKHPQSVAGLVLYALSPAFTQINDEGRAQFVKAHLEPLEAGRSLAELNRTFVRTMHGPKADEEGLRLARDVMGAASPDAYRQSIQCVAHFGEMGSLALLPMPVLVVTGEHDRNAPPKATRRMAQAIPHVTVREIDGTGSLAHVERPDAFNRVVLDFLDHLRERG